MNDYGPLNQAGWKPGEEEKRFEAFEDGAFVECANAECAERARFALMVYGQDLYMSRGHLGLFCTICLEEMCRAYGGSFA